MCSTCGAVGLVHGGHGRGHERGHGNAHASPPCSGNWIPIQTEAAKRELEAYLWHVKDRPCAECQTKHLTKAEGFMLENAVMCDADSDAVGYLKEARRIRAMRKSAG